MAEALEAVAYGGAGRAEAEGFTLRRTRLGSVRLTLPTPSRPPSDAALEAAVRALVSSDPLILPREIAVDVDRGVVRLAGLVDRREQAARAVLLAAAVAGVSAVESRLAWPPQAELARLRGGRTAR